MAAKNNDKPDNKKSNNDFGKLLKKVTKNPYKIPDSILTQLGEHTAGYWLIALDNQGEVGVFENCDNELISESLLRKGIEIVAINEQFSQMEMAKEIARQKGLIPEEENGEGGEDED